jgi:MYXO-CTERM domain-containing protein
MRRAAVALFLASCTLAGIAAAQPEPTAEDIDALMRDLEQEETTLATANCETACRALDAIRRISARICELDPGPPCERSRKKLEDATRRVDNACGPCAPEKKPRKLEDKEVTATGADEGPPPSAPAPEQRGGCASCTIGSRGDPSALWWVLLLTAAFWRRRFSATGTSSSR